MSNEQLHYARMQVGDVWELFAEDGEMRMYKREEEKDGLVVDPLKALHSVRGSLTGCNHQTKGPPAELILCLSYCRGDSPRALQLFFCS